MIFPWPPLRQSPIDLCVLIMAFSQAQYTLLLGEVLSQTPCSLACMIFPIFQPKRNKAVRWLRATEMEVRSQLPMACVEALPKFGHVLRMQCSERGWQSRRCCCGVGRGTPSSWQTQPIAGFTACWSLSTFLLTQASSRLRFCLSDVATAFLALIFFFSETSNLSSKWRACP